ncbi:anthrax toxin receptor-like [Nannospalax galili]|uniref:anthrax toxin receptor-like n=1 Tax=Nannospalax galili TaxID=1026970 RepID=UPI00111BF379|nr:anthrax toxin receptor-like [Nannospalax galili]
MQDCCSQVSCSVFLLLLLRLPVLLVTAHRVLSPHPEPIYPYHESFVRLSGYHNWMGRQSPKEEEVLQYCDGEFDVYFLFDISSNVVDWTDLFTSWEDMVEKYLNPKLRMSFIIFNSQAQIRMPLTSDRAAIRRHLSAVRKLQIFGPTFLHTGLEKVQRARTTANEQIQKVNLEATKRSSLIIAVVWGELSPQEVKESKWQANRARSMGAYVYCVGLGNYNRKQPAKSPPAPAPWPEKLKKKSPPPPAPSPAPAPPVNVSPTVVIICCCACQGMCVSRAMEGNVTMCNLHSPSCHQLPLMWSQCSNQRPRASPIIRTVETVGFPNPSMPCSAFFLLLLLLPPPIFRAGNSRYHRPGWRLFHRLGKGFRSSNSHQVQQTRQNFRQGQERSNCQGIFDLYFVLDKSGIVDNNWIYIYSFVESLVKKYQNPKLRMSFITYSTDAEIVLPLTSDRNKIHDGLSKLQKVVPEGYSYMHEGFKKANEQIQNAKSGGSHVNSVIIALTDGKLDMGTYYETLEKAEKARKMGATIYTVGVFEYDKGQIRDIADSPQHSFGVDNGFLALQDITNSLVSKSCVEVLSVDSPSVAPSPEDPPPEDPSPVAPIPVCAKEFYEVDITGHGFGSTKDKNQVICRFKFKESTDRVIDEKPIRMTDTTIICPGPKIEKSAQEVLLEVSLNNGVSFIGNKLSITSTNCVSMRDADATFNWNLLLFLTALLLIPLLLWCCWRLCCRKPKEPTPPPPQPVKEPEEENLLPPPHPPPPPLPPSPSPVNTNPTVIVACCGCGSRGMQGNLEPCCGYFHPSSHQVPLMWCHPTGRCTNFDCTQASCNPKICLPPNMDYLHLTQPSCTSQTVLQPSRECFDIQQPSCSPNICLRTSRECLPVAQTLGPQKICLSPNQECYSFNNYSQCHQSPPRYTKSPSRMLPLLPPRARQSIESLGHARPHHPTSKGLKFED